jgi:hypothetical protein
MSTPTQPEDSERMREVCHIIRRAIVSHCMGDDLDMSVWYAADMILTGQSQWPRPSFQDNFIAERD